MSLLLLVLYIVVCLVLPTLPVAVLRTWD